MPSPRSAAFYGWPLLALPAPRAVGLGFRQELASDLLLAPHTVDFVEVMAETCLANRAALKEARALGATWPVCLHGVKLSLGSAEGVEQRRLKRLAWLARAVNAVCVSEHISFSRGGPPGSGTEIGHLTGLPMTHEAVAVVAANAAALKSRLHVPLLLENVAWAFAWQQHQMPEEEFLWRVVEATGCGLLLDVGNLRANALNAGRDPVAVLEGCPLHAVAMVHVAGSVVEDGFVYDTHAHALEAGTLALLDHLFARVGPRPVLLERDHNFPAFEDLAAEVADLRMRSHNGGATKMPSARPLPAPVPDAPAPTALLAALQRQAATALTAPQPLEVAGVAPRELARARAILWHKRMDEALPLLPYLSLCGNPERVRAVGAQALSQRVRAPHGAGLADAFAVAQAACDHVEISDAARKDLLLLRARFAGPNTEGAYAPRRLPFAGRTWLDGGRSLWMFKAPGSSGGVTTLQTQPGWLRPVKGNHGHPTGCGTAVRAPGASDGGTPQGAGSGVGPGAGG